MRYWTYRLVKHENGFLYFHEVYYHNEVPCSMTVEPIDIVFDRIEDIKDVLYKLEKAVDKGIFIPPVSWKK